MLAALQQGDSDRISHDASIWRELGLDAADGGQVALKEVADDAPRA
jgi:hypothetical protein